MKAVKIGFGVLAVILVVVAIALFIGLKNLDSIVKTVIEDVGSKVIGTEVALTDVDIELTAGRAELKGLSIANPQGFSAAKALSLGDVAVELDIGSIGKDVLVINEILVNDIRLLAEQGAASDINLQTLLNNVKANSGGGSAEPAPTEPPQDVPSDFRMAVKQINFGGGNIHFLSPQLGENDLKLPPIKVHDLGTAEHGLTPSELATAAMQPLLAQAKQAVRDYAEAQAKKELQKAVEKKLKGKVNEEDLDKLKSLLKK